MAVRGRVDKQLVERLRTIPLFSGCSTRELASLSQFLKVVFGEISLLDRGPRMATVVAETPVRTLSLSSWNFRAALKQHPSMAIKMLEELARRVRTASASMRD